MLGEVERGGCKGDQVREGAGVSFCEWVINVRDG